TTFNVINSLVVFLPSIRLLERAAIALTPKRPGALDLEPKFLERHLLDTPALAIQQAIKELIRMAGIARDALQGSVRAFFHYEPALEEQIRRQENAIDVLQKEITQYLVEASERNLDASDAETLPVLLHSVNDVERIGDHAENLIELAIRRNDQKLELTAQSAEELQGMADVVERMAAEILTTLSNRDATAARRVLAYETRLNQMQVELKESHVARLQHQECHFLSGLMFVSFVDNLEKIGDHLTNIAMAALRRLRWDREPEFQEEGEEDAG
ncbi:MAG: Na/Pi cotransporter family protein, partial [Spirochaetales bacterium]|nr:Na/Pi cotransporter family protein [Spirochaetales bacterium]